MPADVLRTTDRVALFVDAANMAGERMIKGNLDTEIVLDLLNAVDDYDVAFLCSGDSDFERAVDLLRSRRKRVYVLTAADGSVTSAPPGRTGAPRPPT